MSERKAVPRLAARVLLVDEQDRVLLIHGRDPGRPDLPSWWITPGGGLDDGETRADAARRELLEETGLRVGDLGRVVLTRSVEFEFDGEWFAQDEVFYLVRVESLAVGLDTSGWNDIERRALTELRWWTMPELAATTELVFPEGLTELLRDNGIGSVDGAG
jgi:8-oxo-dGTP pyrophosphatase MutT (NUDIX family)